MRKIAFAALILPLLLAPMGSITGSEGDAGARSHIARENPLYANILAQEAGSSTEAVKDAFVLPKTFFGDFINKWLSGRKLKETAQQGINSAQTEIQNAVGQAMGSAQDAIADEIKQRINQAIQGAKHKVEGYINGVVTAVKSEINNLISKIKLFIVDLLKR